MPYPNPDHHSPQSAGQYPGNFLEAGQIAATTAEAVPRASLSRSAHTALWVLRLFAVIVTLMVIYTFITQLR